MLKESNNLGNLEEAIMNKLIMLFAIVSMAIATPVLALEVPEIEDKINKKVNSYRYYNDPGEDHFSTEAEFISEKEAREKGRDCEDYAAQKMRELLRAGYTEDRLDVVYMRVFTRQGFVSHLVLLVDGERVLDNRSGNIYSIQRARKSFFVVFVAPAKKIFARWIDE